MSKFNARFTARVYMTITASNRYSWLVHRWVQVYHFAD